MGAGSLSPQPFVTPETTDPAFTRLFHSLQFSWDFDDNSAASCGGSNAVWANSGQPKNKATHGIAAHTYCAPGTYRPTLTVRNPAGQVSTITQTVVIDDAATAFTAGNTFCMATDATNWAGCPLNCAGGDDNCLVVAPGFFDEAMQGGDNCNGTMDCANADADGRRVLLRRGDTFSINGIIRTSKTSNPGIVSAFGSGPNPMVDLNGGIISEGDRWTWANVDRRRGNGGIGNFMVGPFPSNTGTPSVGVTYYGLSGSESDQCLLYGNLNAAPFWSQLTAFVEVNCTVAPGATFGGAAIWPASDYFVWQGGVINAAGRPAYTVRGQHYQHAMIQHVRFTNPNHDHWSLRTEERSEGGWPGYGANNKAIAYLLLSHNTLELTQDTFFGVRVCYDSGCNCTEGASTCGALADNGSVAPVHDVIVDSNHWKYSGTSSAGGLGFRFYGRDYTVSNNVIDFGAWLPGGTTVFEFYGDTVNATSGAAGNTNCDAFNNTINVDTPSNATFVVATSATGLGHTGCVMGSHSFNNLVVTASGSPTLGGAGGMSSVSNVAGNLAAYPFSSALPSLPARTMSSYRPSAARPGRAFNASSDRSFWNYTDGSGRCRTDGVWDVGALEFGSSACP